jgi:hypothetical protein
MPIAIESSEIRLVHLRTRMPFRYGIATMTHVPLAFVRLRVRVNDRPGTGVASDLLPPKWFTKDPDKPLETEVAEMLRVIRQALHFAAGMEEESAFAIWRNLDGKQRAWGAGQELAPLLTNFGTSLVERAVLEAACRAEGHSFAEALQTDLFRVDLGTVHSDLRGQSPADLLPAKPLDSIIARHTVGLADPLRDDDVPEQDRLDDGLPQSLESCITAYGLRHFKIQVNGDPAQDVPRLGAVAAILSERAGPDHAFSLDGNEQFASIAAFREYWRELAGASALRDWLRHLMFVEQPLHRDAALEDSVGAVLGDWADRPVLIIDESDGSIESLPRALALGYDGTSHKNCKGVFKGVANRCLLRHRERSGIGRQSIMSGEDLCNIGPVALLQDLAVMAALGIESVERNGHHYHAGLSQLPRNLQESVLRHHGDLYHASAAGWPTLSIRNGSVRLESVNAAPFGVGFEVPLEDFEPVK